MTKSQTVGNYPEIFATICQNICDVFISTVLNKTVFHSTIKFEYRNKYNSLAKSYPFNFSNEFNKDVKKVWSMLKNKLYSVPWTDKKMNFKVWKFILVAPKSIMGFSKTSAIQHLSGIHGFVAKKKYIEKMG